MSLLGLLRNFGAHQRACADIYLASCNMLRTGLAGPPLRVTVPGPTADSPMREFGLLLQEHLNVKVHHNSRPVVLGDESESYHVCLHTPAPAQDPEPSKKVLHVILDHK